MKTIALLCLSFIFLQGCSSVAQPKASLNLVEEQFDVPNEPVDEALHDALSNLATNSTFFLSEKTTIIGDKFFAASGFTCRKLKYEEVGFDLFCKNQDDVWFKVNKVISEYNETDFVGADL
jgi:hypothetical protein